jgi:hypothetical protein
MNKKKINLAEVKAAKRALKDIANEHPELLGEQSPENVDGWETTLTEMEMAKTTLVAFRLDNELLKRVDAYAKRLEEQTPGIRLARTDAIRAILLRGLAELEKDQPSPKRRS